jgi:CCR4-NOT complex subunit CAF16
MHLGRVKEWGEAEGFLQKYDDEGGEQQRETGNSRLGEVALNWLREDLRERGPRDAGEWGSEGKTYGFV